MKILKDVVMNYKRHNLQIGFFYKIMSGLYAEMKVQLNVKLDRLITASFIKFDSHFLYILGNLIKQTLTCN